MAAIMASGFQLAIGAPICNKISGAFPLDSFRRTPQMPLPNRNAVSSSQSTQSRQAVPSPIKFIKTKPGKRSVAFARKVVEKKHASSKEYLSHGRVFHLFSRYLYEAIGRENVRFRRIHSTEYIRTRLIALDFILRNQGFTYLESEEQ